MATAAEVPDDSPGRPLMAVRFTYLPDPAR
jgi:hypothetical protein